MRRDDAETVALEALGWLAGDAELLPVFLAATGACESDLRRRAAEPEFLGSVLDFVTLDDAWVVAFCDAAGRDYAAPRAARQALPGGGEVHWT